MLGEVGLHAGQEDEVVRRQGPTLHVSRRMRFGVDICTTEYYEEVLFCIRGCVNLALVVLNRIAEDTYCRTDHVLLSGINKAGLRMILNLL